MTRCLRKTTCAICWCVMSKAREARYRRLIKALTAAAIALEEVGLHEPLRGDDDNRVPQPVEQPVELVQDRHLVDDGLDPGRAVDRARDDVVVSLGVLQLHLERVRDVAFSRVLDQSGLVGEVLPELLVGLLLVHVIDVLHLRHRLEPLLQLGAVF